MSALLGHRGLMLTGGLWSPAQLTVPPKIWLDDASSVTGVSGAASQWNDRSGNAWHFTQGTSDNRPQIVLGELNSKRVIRFDGVNDRMANASMAARGIYRNVSSGWALTVFRRSDSATSTRVLFGSSTNNDAGRSRFRCDIASNVLRLSQLRLDGTIPVTLSGTTSIDSNWHIALWTMDWSSSTGVIYLDGEVEATNSSFGTSGNTANTDSIGSITVGSNMNGTEAYFAGDQAAVIAGSAALPDGDEIDKIFGWAAWRYGLQGNLPPGHPYKDSPP